MKLWFKPSFLIILQLNLNLVPEIIQCLKTSIENSGCPVGRYTCWSGIMILKMPHRRTSGMNSGREAGVIFLATTTRIKNTICSSLEAIISVTCNFPQISRSTLFFILPNYLVLMFIPFHSCVLLHDTGLAAYFSSKLTKTSFYV